MASKATSILLKYESVVKFIAELLQTVSGPEVTATGFQTKIQFFQPNAETVRQIFSKLSGWRSAQWALFVKLQKYKIVLTKPESVKIYFVRSVQILSCLSEFTSICQHA